MGYSFVGFEAASAFNSFVKNWENAVDIPAIVNVGQMDFIEQLSEPKLADICSKFVELELTKKKLTKKQINNVTKFITTLPKEIGFNLWLLGS